MTWDDLEEVKDQFSKSVFPPVDCPVDYHKKDQNQYGHYKGYGHRVVLHELY